MKMFVCGLLCVMSLSSCSRQETSKSSTPAEQSTKPNVEFNTSDKYISSNGNVGVAFAKYGEAIGSVQPPAERITLAELTKSPYSNLGKLIQVKGRVYKVEEMPPSPNMPGTIYEVLMLSDNENSPFGVTTVDCLCLGHVDAKPNKVVSCGGYFVGTYETQNAMGGNVEALTIVGNTFVGGKK